MVYHISHDHLQRVMGIFKTLSVVNSINYSIVLTKNLNEFKSFAVSCTDGSIVVFPKNKWCNYTEDFVRCIIAELLLYQIIILHRSGKWINVQIAYDYITERFSSVTPWWNYKFVNITVLNSFTIQRMHIADFCQNAIYTVYLGWWVIIYSTSK